MYRDLARYGKFPAQVTRSKTTGRAPLSWAKHGPNQRVFTCSWSDWFIPQADAWRDEAWDIIRRTPNLTYLILTKRPELAVTRLPADWGAGWPHVWIGASMEDQLHAKLRMKYLLAIPAQHRFVSCGPLLGPVDLAAATPDDPGIWGRVDAMLEAEYGGLMDQPFSNEFEENEWEQRAAQLGRRLTLQAGIHWVIAEGESGPDARQCHPDWVRALRDECVSAEIPFLFKQWGEYLPLVGNEKGVEFQKVGKRKAGRLLDGKEWQQFPEW